jgi:hypothetical protein
VVWRTFQHAIAKSAAITMASARGTSRGPVSPAMVAKRRSVQVDWLCSAAQAIKHLIVAVETWREWAPTRSMSSEQSGKAAGGKGGKISRVCTFPWQNWVSWLARSGGLAHLELKRNDGVGQLPAD